MGQLWVQEGLRRGDFTLWKVLGERNPADILTKCVSREILDRHLKMLSLNRVDGRAATAPLAQLPGGGDVRATVPSIVQPSAIAQTGIPGALPIQPAAIAQTGIPGALPPLLGTFTHTGHLPHGPAIAAKPGRWYTLPDTLKRYLGWHLFH